MSRILFLYSRLSGYMYQCLTELANQDCELTVVHRPIATEAPFEFSSPANFKRVSKDELSDETELVEFCHSLKPSAVFVSGWMDKSYLQFIKTIRNSIPVVLLADTKWRGTLKQKLHCIASQIGLGACRHFNHAWVAGKLQREYVSRLGFPQERIQEGVYCADVNNFAKNYELRASRPPKRQFLYVGRYLPRKGVEELWQGFLNFRRNNPQWELHCIGTGAGWPDRCIEAGIVHHGFMQPAQLGDFILDSAAFVMPSRFEPWGVALQEMAASGLPVIASAAVGASERYLHDCQNGFFTVPESAKSIEEAFCKFSELSATETQNMSRHSHELGTSYTPKHWARTAMSFLDPTGK